MTKPQTPDANAELMANVGELQAEVRGKILHTLEIYPFVSQSMLHIAIGSATCIKLWKPVLATLIAEGLVCERIRHATTSTDRHQSYTILMLTKNLGLYNDYAPTPVANDEAAKTAADNTTAA